MQPSVADIRPDDEAGILRDAESKLRRKGGIRSFRGLVAEVRLITRMLRDRTFSLGWPSRAVLLGALAYFILPTDITPDYIPGIGLIDDAAVVSLVLRRLAHEVDRYRAHLRDADV